MHTNLAHANELSTKFQPANALILNYMSFWYTFPAIAPY